jgi:hypothetical protein
MLPVDMASSKPSPIFELQISSEASRSPSASAGSCGY